MKCGLGRLLFFKVLPAEATALLQKCNGVPV
jgi:hypothetical protein